MRLARSEPDLPPVSEKPGPRDRIVAVARDLFYRNGVRGVGVEAIAEAAGTNKMTLYRHFQSKDLLIAACLRAFATEREADWERVRQLHADDPEQLLRAWVHYVSALMIEEADRGCALANAAIELPDRDHPARAVIEEFKTAQRDRLVLWCREAGYAEPDHLADELFLLLEGARVSIQSVGVTGPGSRLGAMMTTIIDHHARVVRE
jgi:AcrR family transcriptional regulator